MNLEQSSRSYGMETVENYPLIFSRSQEIAKVRESLEEYPIAFIRAPSGNGKTGFGREFRQSRQSPKADS